MDATAGRIGHIAINADNIDASQAFYESTFGWTFDPHFGMDDFLRASGPDGTEPGPFAVLQRRRDLGGVRVVGVEPTVSVVDLDVAVAAAIAAGGRVLAEPVTIPTVGRLAWLADPSGNVVGAMQYESS